MNIFSIIVQILLMIFIVLYPILPSFGKFSADILIILLAIFQVINLLCNKNERKSFFRDLFKLKNNLIVISALIFNLTMYISAFVATNVYTTIGYSARFSMYIFAFYMLAYSIKSKEKFNIFLNTFVFTNLIIGMVTIYQTLIDNSVITETNRIASTLENSNNLGAYTILSIFIVFSLILNSPKRKAKILYSVIFLLQLFNLVACQSRNALIALIVGSLLFAILYDKRYLISTLILPIIVLIIPQTRIRFLEILDPTQNESRIKLWKTALLMIKENLPFGIGYENFQYLYQPYITEHADLQVWHSYQAYHPHNIFLKIQCELGILGTLSFLLFIAAIIFTFYKLFKIGSNRLLIISICSSLFAFQAMNVIDSFYTSPKIVITMFVLLAFITNNYVLKNNTFKR